MPIEQLRLPFGALRNNALFSNHWLENRLHLEPEWNELRQAAFEAIQNLAALWEIQRARVEHYGDEQGLEQAFIQPVFLDLGWKLKYQTFLHDRKPDYALFLHDDSLDRALQAGRTSPDFWKHPALVADAKKWKLSLDRPSTVNNKREYPPEQIEWYLNHSHLSFGILTNGKLWRLVPREYSLQQRRFQTYLQLDLEEFLERWRAESAIEQPSLFGMNDTQAELFDEFQTFYLFFGPTAHRQIDGRLPLIQRAIEGSSEYRLGVGEGLKGRAFESLRLCIEGLLSNSANELDSSTQLNECREQSLILLYRLLFIMYAEDRKLLPYKVNQTYTNNRSLGRKRDEIGSKLEKAAEGRDIDYANDAFTIWLDLIDLFDLVDRGHKTYGVPAYNGGLFDSEIHSFLTEKQISDAYMSRIIDQLSRSPDLYNPNAGLFRVDYYDLAIQHLGGIYEGLLELHPHYASERMRVIRKHVRDKDEERIEPVNNQLPQGYMATGVTYEPGSIYLLTDKGERRASGSYYTPDHIVEHIVQSTIGPLCKEIQTDLENEVVLATELLQAAKPEEIEAFEEKLTKLKSDFDDRVLNLRILDPAMGSGHFLLSACQYLAEEIATHPYTGDSALSSAPVDESALVFWKRRVVERCLYGVDMNPMAVELAKLALWLETVAADQPLSFLDHHLRCGNSLIGARISKLGVLPNDIDLYHKFEDALEKEVPAFLEPLNAIRDALSDTVEQVKTKERLLKRFEKAREPYRQVADVWSAAFTEQG